MKVRTKLILGGTAALALAYGMHEQQGNHPYANELAAQTDSVLQGQSFDGRYMGVERLSQPVTATILDTAVAQMEQHIQDGHNPRNDILGYCGIAGANGLLDSPDLASDPLVKQIHGEAAGLSLAHVDTIHVPQTLAEDCKNLDLRLSSNAFAEFPIPLS